MGCIVSMDRGGGRGMPWLTHTGVADLAEKTVQPHGCDDAGADLLPRGRFDVKPENSEHAVNRNDLTGFSTAERKIRRDEELSKPVLYAPCDAAVWITADAIEHDTGFGSGFVLPIFSSSVDATINRTSRVEVLCRQFVFGGKHDGN